MARGTDLVSELHRGERQEKRRHVRRRIYLLIFLAILGVAGKIAFDRFRVARLVSSARTHLLAGAAEDVDAAVEELERNLTVDPGHAETLALLALARAHQVLVFASDPAPAEASIAAAMEARPPPEIELYHRVREMVDPAHETPPPAPELAVARSVLALASFDRDAAEAGIADIAGDSSLVAHYTALMRGLVALSRVHEPSRLQPALDQLEKTEGVAESPALLRLAANLEFRSGAIDAALARLEEGRAKHFSDLGLAVDEALFHGVLRRNLGGVIQSSKQLLTHEGTLAPRDHGRAMLAHGIAQLYRGEADQGRADVQKALELVPLWDQQALDLALEALLITGDVEGGRKIIEANQLDETGRGILEAWALAAEGNVVECLEKLADMPQDRPRVAYVQALALVEQRRFAEAKAWVERAASDVPGRAELAVAQARVEAQVGDAKQALASLEELSSEQPSTFRVWTALGEAHLRAEKKGAKEKASKAFEQAIEREPIAAEAMLQLGLLRRERARKKPTVMKKAVAALERAVEANSFLPRYRKELGLVLADIGYRARAAEVLGGVVEEPALDGTTRLKLVEVTLEHAHATSQPVPDGVEDWLARALATGATERAVELERARMDFVHAKDGKLAEARSRLEGMLQTQPADVEARLLYARVLMGQGNYPAAQATLDAGIAIIHKGQRGRLYLLRAKTQRGFSKKKKKEAARDASFGWKEVLAEGREAVDLIPAAQLTVRLWLAVDREPMAQNAADELRKRVPYHADAWVLHGEVAMKLDRAQTACKSAKKAIEIDDEHAGAHALRGACLVAVGKRDDARKSYERAVSLADGTPAARRYARLLGRL